MAQLHESRIENSNSLNIDEAGKDLNISSTGPQMRLLECPKCTRRFIRQKRTGVKYADCVCGVRIHLKRRWYD